MARVPYRGPQDGDAALFDRLAQERGEPVENIFLALANAPAVASAVLTMATALRQQTALDRQLRELAVLSVGQVLEAEYELAHHHNSAVRAGLGAAKLAGLSQPEQSGRYSEAELAVIDYARAVTTTGRADAALWSRITRALPLQEQVELVVTVAWYNAVVRMILPLEIDIEDWLVLLEPGQP
ncbi:carboxymuconolactone decarboxylase family protein [Devosia ginsengisoli]|uniref:carboxymuconolactone decarboxylase family protein n=1 Tax=Devosia ginsengisoli TaxID=400770 RepID=UPI0016443109|nr:carboxymuconolactone decarboxylase family protein [Devosia ginsengisoli]